MQLSESISLKWSKRIPSDSRAVNLLGLWGRHLKIQEDFTPAITSVTRRTRYYTLWMIGGGLDAARDAGI